MWMASIERDGENTTLVWVGWNTNLIQRGDNTQKNLPQINMSPTSHAVVVESLKHMTW